MEPGDQCENCAETEVLGVAVITTRPDSLPNVLAHGTYCPACGIFVRDDE